MKGVSSKRTALKVDGIQSQKTVCRMSVRFEPGNFTVCGSEGVKEENDCKDGH